MLSCEYCKIFKNIYFEEHLQTTVSVLLIIKLLIKYWASGNLFLIKKHNMEWFPLKRFVDLLRIYFLLIISKNHSTRVKCYSKGYLYWYQDCDRFMLVVVHYLIYTFNDMQINTGFPIVGGGGSMGCTPSILPFFFEKTRPPKPMPPHGAPSHLKMKPPIWKTPPYWNMTRFHEMIPRKSTINNNLKI